MFVIKIDDTKLELYFDDMPRKEVVELLQKVEKELMEGCFRGDIVLNDEVIGSYGFVKE